MLLKATEYRSSRFRLLEVRSLDFDLADGLKANILLERNLIRKACFADFEQLERWRLVMIRLLRLLAKPKKQWQTLHNVKRRS